MAVSGDGPANYSKAFWEILRTDCYRSGSPLPTSLNTLSLCDNQLGELRDLSHLAHLSRLEQLTISGNPCVQQEEQIEKQFDYRPYVINWCLGLRTLDGLPVGAKESLKVGILIINVATQCTANV